MSSYNRVILVGNLTCDPELRHIPSGTAVTDIGMAINDKHKDASGNWVEETTFVDVTLWAKTAEVACQYLKKGSSCLIEGFSFSARKTRAAAGAMPTASPHQRSSHTSRPPPSRRREHQTTKSHSRDLGRKPWTLRRPVLNVANTSR